jgi:hypothetical protein
MAKLDRKPMHPPRSPSVSTRFYVLTPDVSVGWQLAQVKLMKSVAVNSYTDGRSSPAFGLVVT